MACIQGLCFACLLGAAIASPRVPASVVLKCLEKIPDVSEWDLASRNVAQSDRTWSAGDWGRIVFSSPR
jgi:hypothetical protein